MTSLAVARTKNSIYLICSHAFSKPFEPSVSDESVGVFTNQMLEKEILLRFANHRLELPYVAIIWFDVMPGQLRWIHKITILDRILWRSLLLKSSWKKFQSVKPKMHLNIQFIQRNEIILFGPPKIKSSYLKRSKKNFFDTNSVGGGCSKGK